MIRVTMVDGSPQFHGTNEELETVRQGGEFTVDMFGTKCIMKCDPNYVNVKFIPVVPMPKELS